MTENVATPFVCSECRKLNQNWYAPCPHACLIVPLLATLQFISDGLHKAANGGFTGAGEKCTVGRLKNLIRNYRDVAAAAIVGHRQRGGDSMSWTKEQGKHTPGPWREGEANARLIAAAPDLLEMLTRCVKLLEIANIAGKSTYASDVRMGAQAAIAKAEGRQ